MKLNRKNKLLLLGFIVIIYFCYNFAISKTIYYYKQYKSQQEMFSNTISSPKILAQLLLKEKQIDKITSQNNVQSTSFQNELLKELSNYCDAYQLKIVNFQEPHMYTEKETTTTSYSFSIEGSFNRVIMLLNKMENKQNLGIIKHVNSVKKTNFKTNQDYLVTTIIIQKIDLQQ